ncbi:MAG: Hsp20/alpha crystallin family protein [Anaerolineales bacterium]|jgi:HSP20 family protein
MPTHIRKSRSTTGELRKEVLHAVGWQVQVRSGMWSPPTDVYETDNDYVVRVEVAGMREDGFDISVEDKFLTISGNRPDVPERRAYQQMEIRFGKFETVVGLPGPIDLETSRADYKEGFLTVTLPKAKPNHIQIEEEK